MTLNCGCPCFFFFNLIPFYPLRGEIKNIFILTLREKNIGSIILFLQISGRPLKVDCAMYINMYMINLVSDLIGCLYGGGGGAVASPPQVVIEFSKCWQE